jgi:hypothetical protein
MAEEQDPDYCAIVVSALRYALPRHSYMPEVTRAYITRNWAKLKPMHWCILRDTREYIERCKDFYMDDKFDKFSEREDYVAWLEWYNELVELPATELQPYNAYLGKIIILEEVK